MKRTQIARSIAVALLSLTMTACSGGSGPADSPDPASQTPNPQPPPVAAPPTPAQTISAMEDKGELPKLDRSDSIAGTDANQNGVRDDIDAIITARFTEPGQRNAALQSARALQSALTVDINDKSATNAASQAMMNATNCIYERFPVAQGAPVAGATTPGALARELEAMTTNTKTRLQTYLKFNKALDGSVSSIPKGSTCE